MQNLEKITNRGSHQKFNKKSQVSIGKSYKKKGGLSHFQKFPPLNIFHIMRNLHLHLETFPEFSRFLILMVPLIYNLIHRLNLPITDKNIRTLEQIDEMLLSKIMGCDANTNNIFKYLELGVCPVRFEIKKRKILFLHYLLQEDHSTMVYKVLTNRIKNEFVQTCENTWVNWI